MLKKLSTDENVDHGSNVERFNCCTNRVKPTMLNGVKTEAVLVFARTALERYFTFIKEEKHTPKVGSREDTEYVYNTLYELNKHLQESVVNADYLIDVVQGAKVDTRLRRLAKYEEPLIDYYDAMASYIKNYYTNKPAYIPEFLIISLLSHWILEEGKSVELYPFLEKIDFTLLISKFELNREEFQKDGECVISEIFLASSGIVEILKNAKYKVNKARVSKTRKKK